MIRETITKTTGKKWGKKKSNLQLFWNPSKWNHKIEKMKQARGNENKMKEFPIKAKSISSKTIIPRCDESRWSVWHEIASLTHWQVKAPPRPTACNSRHPSTRQFTDRAAIPLDLIGKVFPATAVTEEGWLFCGSDCWSVMGSSCSSK